MGFSVHFHQNRQIQSPVALATSFKKNVRVSSGVGSFVIEGLKLVESKDKSITLVNSTQLKEDEEE